MDSITIERIKLKDLPALAERLVHSAAPGDFIPITIHRAQAHAHNPHARPNDVALLLAKAGEAAVGYFGLMPVTLQVDGKRHIVHWLTTWGVAPGYLGRGLGSALMEAALALDVDLAIVGSLPARRVSAKHGFVEAEPLDYAQIDLGAWAAYNPLTLALRLLRKLLSLLGVRWSLEKIEPSINRFFETLLGPLWRRLCLAALFRRLPPAAAAARMAPLAQVGEFPVPAEHTGFVRQAGVVNWMLAHPWVLPKGQSTSEKLNYGFTDSRPEFACHAWSVAGPQGEDWGFVCLQSSRIRDRRVLKVLDHHFPPGAPAGLLAALALQQARRLRVEVVEGPAELAAPLAGGWLGSLLLRRKQRTLQLHPRGADSPLARALPRLHQTYPDGDTAFT
ncbi:MAG: GNAT family N-acetyltransferase [Anaerolineales bacterium]|nr:GNAT family N-acetyltransferase [Anaerolineales bacterium]